jgi:hypothetical protein
VLLVLLPVDEVAHGVVLSAPHSLIVRRLPVAKGARSGSHIDMSHAMGVRMPL